VSERLNTVTQGPWCVSSTSPAYEFPSADGWSGTGRVGVRLSVFRTIHHGPEPEHKTARGDHDGRWFPDRDACQAFALEHGYTELHYRRQWCPVHRVLHHFLGRPSPWLSEINGAIGCDSGSDFHGYDNLEQRAELRRRAITSRWASQRGAGVDFFDALKLAEAEYDATHHKGHFSQLGGAWWCDTCDSPYCELA
jgi:hypothetical protein